MGIKDPLRRRLARTGAYHAVRLGRGYLRDTGWIRSMIEGRPVRADGSPMPWMCYSVVDLLSERLPDDARVFEWGSGASTEWFASVAREVVAVEHDEAWYESVARALPQNAQVIYQGLSTPAYERQILDQGEFDLVVIDGRKRVECSAVAGDCLSARGVILWDNTDRSRYEVGMSGLSDAGFRRIDFKGLVPVSYRPKSTSIFYRDGNLLAL